MINGLAAKVAAIVLFVSVLAVPALAQRELAAKKLTVLPKFDGVVTEGEWSEAVKIEVGFDEQTGAPCPDRQEFWLGFDQKYIYIAARLADPSPGTIAANEYRSNVNIQGDDHIVFAIDPFGNLQNLNQFRVNARGGTQLQISGGRAIKREWIGEILAAGRITESGWECEARIPWGLMKLPSPGVRTVRADFGRAIRRTGRAYITSNISSERIENITKWTGVEVPKAEEKKTLKLLPFGYGGYERDGNDTIANAGVDLKTSLNEQLEFVGTISPDFRNIENSVLSLDFSYFERLAGESRPFFIEGQEYFSTSRDASLFASQRIRSFDAGMKVYGKFNDQTTVAFVNTNDFGHESAYAGNVQYQFRPRETMRIAGTLLDRKGRGNTANFISYSRPLGDYSFFGQYSSTHDDEAGDGDRFNAGFQLEKGGMNGHIEYQQISPDYLPRLGFAPRRNFKGWSGQFEFNQAHRHPQILETEYGIGWTHQDDYNGKPFRRAVSFSGSLTMRDLTDLDFEAEYEEIQGFKDRTYVVSLENPRGDAYRSWFFTYAWGNVAGHAIELINPGFRIRPKRNFQITFSHEELNHIEREKQSIMGLNYEVNRYDSVSARIRRRDDDTNFYLAWRRAGNRGIEYYVIVGDPNARTFQESVIVKAVIPIEVVLGR
ncbi:MAG TPA: DUF5916 domain-containing protein [Fimbriimonadaceae bacterium]|nr:DUF5916 domain-containing protein [Fimbriimonadaceae bacterium]